MRHHPVLRGFAVFESNPTIGYDLMDGLIERYGWEVVVGELVKAHTWLLANPNRRKKNYGRFIGNWFNKADLRVVARVRPEDWGYVEQA